MKSSVLFSCCKKSFLIAAYFALAVGMALLRAKTELATNKPVADGTDDGKKD